MDDMPTIRGPGEVVLLQRAACLHIKYENEQGRGICKQGRDGLCSPMPNECIYLAVRKLFSFPHAQLLLAFFPRTSCMLARACGVFVRKRMAGESSSWTPACRLEFVGRSQTRMLRGRCRVPKVLRCSGWATSSAWSRDRQS